MIIGRQPVMEAIQSGKQLEKIYIQTDARGMIIDELRSLAQQNSIPLSNVPIAKLDGFNITGHEGCVAILAKVQYHDLQEVISFVGPTILVHLLSSPWHLSECIFFPVASLHG